MAELLSNEDVEALMQKLETGEESLDNYPDLEDTTLKEVQPDSVILNYTIPSNCKYSVLRKTDGVHDYIILAIHIEDKFMHGIAKRVPVGCAKYYRLIKETPMKRYTLVSLYTGEHVFKKKGLT